MRPKKLRINPLALLSFVLLISIALPNNVVRAEENEEINYLLNFVAESGCTFIRNGTEHQGKEASEHLAMKYNYYKDRIKTAEGFIDKIATKSSFSGRKYEVLCNEKRTATRLWLEKALAAYRASATDQPLTMCPEPRPQMCTMDYRPVCAEQKDRSSKTFSNGCTSCSDPEVIGYREGKCPEGN